MVIKKSSGEKVPYSEKKLRISLMRAGASEEQAENILEVMGKNIYEGMSTKEIYRLAFRLLKENARHLAAKYHLKYAMMELGPSGFPFEKYIAEIMRHQGYRINTGQIIAGRCINHEIDVVAEKKGSRLFVECKYHSQPGIFCDVKIPLYLHARFNDVIEKQATLIRELSLSGLIITNTRFSTDATDYANCAGLKLMSWDYPSGNGLKDQVDSLGLYPITCLTSLTRAEKQILLERNKVLCLEIQENPLLLEQAGLKPNRVETALQEVHLLCQQTNRLNTKQTYSN